jgi:hypothetical protein
MTDSFTDSTDVISKTAGSAITVDIDLISSPKTLAVGRHSFSVEYVPWQDMKGLNLYIYPTLDQVGYTPIRFFLISKYDSTSLDPTDIRLTWKDIKTNLPLSFYDGSNEYFVGSKLVENHKANEPIIIPLTNNLSDDISLLGANSTYTLDVGMVFESLDSRDLGETSIGFVGAQTTSMPTTGWSSVGYDIWENSQTFLGNYYGNLWVGQEDHVSTWVYSDTSERKGYWSVVSGLLRVNIGFDPSTGGSDYIRYFSNEDTFKPIATIGETPLF